MCERARRTRGGLSALALAAALTGVVPGLQAQALPSDPDLRAPYLAWDRGDYPEAMRGYLALLDGPRGAELKDAIARLTGELHPVVEVAPNGEGLAMAPDGRAATFRVVESGATVTKVVAMPQGRVVATVPSAVTALLGEGMIAYARPVQGAAGARVVEVRVRTLADGQEQVVPTGGWAPYALIAADGALLALATDDDEGERDLIELAGGEVRRLEAPGLTRVFPVAGGRWLIGAVEGIRTPSQVQLIDRRTRVIRRFQDRRAPAVSADGSTLAMVSVEDGDYALEVLHPDREEEPRVILRGDRPIGRLAVSPTGALIAYEKQPADDWEVFTVATDAGVPVEELDLTSEIQHDRRPMFLGAGTVLAIKGEGRHQRSYVYDRVGSEPLKLFANNTLRTIAPEYEWAATPDGQQVLIVADRDGDTVSPERGVYMVDRTLGIGRSALRARLEANLTRELDLRARGSRAFLPISDAVRQRTQEVSAARIREEAEALALFGSRAVGAPGNAAALDYLTERLREWGYGPELQPFQYAGDRTANVVARLPGTTSPDVVYTVSSHFDSVEEGPGADDNGSGTTALLEIARVLAEHPQPATIEFAFFSGEESGLLGAEEYVRRARAEGKRVRGALNNDMVGWRENDRLDNTVRYSNAGIRDLQHAAAIQYSRLITYDSRYYQSTDAHPLFDGFGDVLGGIGSHPVLGNPHYHQPTDRLGTIDHDLVAEVAKTTLASIMMLASSPSRVDSLALRALPGGELELSWSPAPERDVTGWVVRWTDRLGALREDRVAGAAAARPPETRLDSLRAAFDPDARPATTFRLRDVRPGTAISVKAIDARGMEGWDWSTVLAPS